MIHLWKPLLPFTGKHILYPFSRIDVSLVAGDYEGVDHGSAICSRGTKTLTEVSE